MADNLPSRTFAMPESPIKTTRQEVSGGGIPGFVMNTIWKWLGWFTLFLAVGTLALVGYGVYVDWTWWFLVLLTIAAVLLALFTKELWGERRAASRKAEAELAIMRQYGTLPWLLNDEILELMRQREDIARQTKEHEAMLDLAKRYADPLIIDQRVSPTPQDALLIMERAKTLRAQQAEPVYTRGGYTIQITSARTEPLIPGPLKTPVQEQAQIKPVEVPRTGASMATVFDEEEVLKAGQLAVQQAQLRKRGKRKEAQIQVQEAELKVEPEPLPQRRPLPKRVYGVLTAERLREALRLICELDSEEKSPNYRRMVEPRLIELGLTRGERESLRALFDSLGLAVKSGPFRNARYVIREDLSDDDLLVALKDYLR